MKRSTRPGPSQSGVLNEPVAQPKKPSAFPSWILVVVFVISLLALIPFAWVLILNATAAETERGSRLLPGVNGQLLYHYARLAPYGGDTQLTLNFLPDEGSNTPVTLEVFSPDPDLLLEDPAVPGYARSLRFTLRPGHAPRAVAALVNVGEGPGLVRIPTAVLVRMVEGSQVSPVAELGVSLEPRIQAALRGIPLLAQPSAVLAPLITGLVSLFTWVLKRRDENEPKQKAEAAALLAQLRGALKAYGGAGAERLFGQLRRQKLGGYLDPLDWLWAARLAGLPALSDHRPGWGASIADRLAPLRDCPPAWREETAGALHALGRQLDPGQRTDELFQAFVLFYKGCTFEGCDPRYARDAEILLQQLKIRPLTPAAWPPYPPAPGQGRPLERSPRDQPLYDPFIDPRAENETALLFNEHRGVFWEEHPAYLQAAPEQPPYPLTCLFGPAGCGLTAFGLQFGRYSGKSILDTLLTTRIEADNAIPIAFANRLAEFACANPGQLSQLDAASLKTLAELLGSQLGAEQVRLMAAQERAARNAAAPADGKRDPVREEALAQLDLFLAALEAPARASMPPQVWLQALRKLGDDFGFKTFRAVVEDGGTPLDRWLDARAAQLDLLRAEGFQVIFLAEETTLSACEPSLTARGVIPVPLAWKEDQLSQMVFYRWEMLNPGIQITEHYRDLYELALGESRCRPADFIRQWRNGLKRLAQAGAL